MLSQQWSCATLGDGLNIVEQFSEQLLAADPSTDEMTAELAVSWFVFSWSLALRLWSCS